MTVVTEEPPLTEPGERSPRRRRITIAAISVVCILAVAALAVLGWKWRHPTFFPSASNSVSEGVTTRPGVVTWIGMTYPNTARAPVTLHVDGVEPRVDSDSADAHISFFICTNIQPPGPGELALGSVRGNVSSYCSHLVPASNVDMAIGRGHYQSIVMRVVATRLGQVRVNGIDLRYRDGWQDGTQWTGYGVVVTAR